MVEVTSSGDSLESLEPFIGEWLLVAVFKHLPPADADARVSFEWLPGKTFLIERWEFRFRKRPMESRSSAPIARSRATTSSTTSTRAASRASTR
jgi:hypothetical protein